MIENLSMFFVLSGVVCATLIIIDVNRYPQKMEVMNTVWSLTGLWASLIGILTYIKIGKTNKQVTMPMNMDMDMPAMPMTLEYPKPLWQRVMVSTLHCGAGCTLADIIGESITIYYPIAINGNLLAGQWTLDYILALLFGIGFQYAAIKPMENLSTTKTIVKAFKIDFFSLTSWQIGMYGWMAIAIFGFNNGVMIPKDTWYFWFIMQIAMFCGFITAYPTNWILIKLGIKKAM